MEGSRKRRDSRSTRENPLGAKPPNPLSRDAFPDEFTDLLHLAILRRRTGLLLLGSPPVSSERELMLTEALAVTADIGLAGFVLDTHLSAGVDIYAHGLQTGVGSLFACSKQFQDLPRFPSVQKAYAGGCRRIALEYDKHNCEPYCPLPFEQLVEYANDVCLILTVDHVSCESAFEWTTASASTWQDLDHLIGVLCWSVFPGTRHAVALYDAIVPADPSLRPHQFDIPADAVRDGRQLRWERQALRLLDSNQITWRQLWNHLYTAGIIDPDLEFGAAGNTRTKEGLRDWLVNQLIHLRTPIAPAPAAPGGRIH